MDDLYIPNNFRKIERRKIVANTDLKSRSAKTLMEWWSSYAPRIPTRNDFDILKVPSIAADIYLIEVLAEGQYRYRLSGEQVVGLVGRRYHMTEISVDDSNVADAMFAEYVKWAIAEGGINGCIGTLAFFGKDFIEFESIDCPLVDTEGATTHIVGVLCQTGGFAEADSSLKEEKPGHPTA